MQDLNITTKYDELVANKKRYEPLWEDISKYSGIKVDPNNKQNFGDALDQYALDPTSALSTIQSADYLKGVLIGTFENGFSLLPSDECLEYADIDTMKDWFDYASGVSLREMNDPRAGFHSSFSSYFYDQSSFGTSGIGCFRNYLKDSVAQNALIFRSYGIDTLAIDEGKNGTVELIYNTYRWRTNEFVSEFATVDGEIDTSMFDNIPEKIRKAYEGNQMNEVFEVVHCVMPRKGYSPKYKGKMGTAYVGYWFLRDEDKNIFLTEDYKERPISIGRPIKVRGEVYGRAYGTMLVSATKCVNEIINGLMITLDKMREPALGTFGGLSGDKVIDTSSGALTTFNPDSLAGNMPVFKIQDIGDPTGLINFLLPYFNEKIATAYKIDLLLDFAQSANMTATESLQRYSIRNKSILGLVIQQISDVIIPTIKRSVSILYDMGRLGIDPRDLERVEELSARGLVNRIIPEAVIKCIEEGKPWYRIRFNNEVEKISNTDRIDNLIKMLEMTTALLSVSPDLALAINWYAMLEDVSKALGMDKFLMSEKQFKEQIQARAEQQSQAMQLQAQEINARANKDNAQAMGALNGK